VELRKGAYEAGNEGGHEGNLFEASMVKRPDFPDARIIGRPISRADVEETLGASLPAGAQPVCDRCLTPCAGI
jgi:hypothetical protein